MERKEALKRLGALVMVMALLFSLGACGKEDEPQQEEKAKVKDLQKVTVVLDYVPNTNHTGIYVAKDQGYYQEEGLDVDIVEPTYDATNTLIAAGKGDFGISFQEDVIYAREAEDPLPIKAIAAIIQHNTSGFATYAPKDIDSPREFEGMTYAGWGSPAEAAIIKAVMKKDGGDFSKLNMVTSDTVTYDMLKDKVDIIWLYWAWDGIAAKRAGMDINYMELKSFDKRLDYYTPVIVANEKTLEKDPKMVKAFLRATEKGYRYAVEKPDDAAGILHKFCPDYDIGFLKESQEYLSWKYYEGAKIWGSMKESVWQGYMDFMKENNLIEGKAKAKDCYTNDYLPE